MGVHVRGTDKILEAARLDEVNAAYKDVIDKHCEKHRVDTIFLITDDEEIRRTFKKWYGNRLVYTEAVRGSGEQGVHYQEHGSREQLGVEVAVDAYLASRCNYFLGNGSSNVSNAVAHLTDWVHGDCNLFGGCRWYQYNIVLHNRVS